MLDRLEHRGPDERGVWHGDSTTLGHTRLSIIDTEGSHQPFVRDGGSMVYNGEVFNYAELRDVLPGPFCTAGDTEVIERVLATSGTAGLQEVRGQFAVARWDQAQGRLQLVRDAVGVLPLFWSFDGTSFAFASEVDALLRALPRTPEVDVRGLSMFLGYRSVPAPWTMWQGVHKLPPGHALSISFDDPVPRLHDWRPDPADPDPSMSVEAAASCLEDRLAEAVRRCLVADVPVGAYLSGGLDSSLIVALAQRQREEPMNTYCASFGDASTDESTWAALVAGHLGTRHVDVPVSGEDFLSEWPRLSRLRGAPVSEPSDVAVNHLAERASQDVKVVLSGEGSDELFAGYPKHRLAALTRHVGLVPATLRQASLALLADALPRRARRGSVALRALAQPTEDARIRSWFASFTPSERERLVGQPVLDPDLDSPAGLHPLLRMLRHDQGAWLSDNLLERGDRMTMGASVELRPPFLDYDVVDLSRRMPARVLLHDGATKAVVRRVARSYLPAGVLDRRKAGFTVPLAAWLRGDLKRPMHRLLLSADSFVMQRLDPPSVRSLVSRHVTGRADESKKLWTLLSLEMWARNHG